MARTNPYNIRGMIPIDSDMFFGREREMRRIEDLLSGDTPQCVSIIGEPRIGKSSLAFRVLHEIRKTENIIAVLLNCKNLQGNCETKGQFFQELNQMVEGEFEEKPKIKELLTKEETPFFEDYSSFKAFLKRTSRKGIKMIIFMDEFEHLPDTTKYPFADDAFFSNLRAVANNPDNRLAFVTVSHKPLKDLIKRSDHSTSEFWNIFQVQHVGLVEDENICNLRQRGFKKVGLSLKEEEFEKIEYYAGRFPFFNQIVCEYIYEAKKNNVNVNWSELEVTLSSYYRTLWDERTKEEQKLLKYSKRKKYKNHISLKEMQTRGLVIKKSETYFPFSEYFEYLIRSRFKVKRKKVTLKTIIHYIKEAMCIAKTGKVIVTGKQSDG